MRFVFQMDGLMMDMNASCSYNSWAICCLAVGGTVMKILSSSLEKDNGRVR